MFFRCRSAAAAPILLVAMAVGVPPAALAGPITTVITGQSLSGVQTTLNNSWNQSYQVAGPTAAADGGTTIQPIAATEQGFSRELPATFVEAVIDLEPQRGRALVSAVSGYSSRAGREDPGFQVRPQVVQSLGQLRLVPDPEAASQTLAGGVAGRNIGTELLAVFGRLDTIPRQLETTVLWF